MLGSKKSCRAKAALPRKPPIAVAFGGVGAPLRQLRCFFATPGAKHLGRADFLRPTAEMKLAETIDDPVIGGLIRPARGLDTQGADGQKLWSRRALDSDTNRCDVGGVDRTPRRGNRQCVRLKAGCSQRRAANHALRTRQRCANPDRDIAGAMRGDRYAPA